MGGDKTFYFAELLSEALGKDGSYFIANKLLLKPHFYFIFNAFNLVIDLRKRETETLLGCGAYLRTHWLLCVCALTRD